MDSKEFSGLFKDLINHIYDYAALETHPLTGMLTPPPEHNGNRATYLQQLIYRAIETLRPSGREPAPNAPEWRPYLILYRRYVDGIAPPALAAELHLSDRQLRRDHSRALEALASTLWDQTFQAALAQAATPTEESPPSLKTFDLHPEPLALNQVLQSVVSTLQPKLQAEGIDLRLELPPQPALALSDRVILRQILFSLCNYAFYLQVDRRVQISLQTQAEHLLVIIQVNVDEKWGTWDAEERTDTLEPAHYWAQRLDATLTSDCPPPGQSGVLRLRLALPGLHQPVILVIDDQQAALRMYQRYLSRTPFTVMGVSDPTQALALTRLLQPALVLLDVMMPHIDGWEILQALRLDTQTRSTPVIVCSAWEASELARSLGAADFLKKPVTQKRLLAALEPLNLPS